VKRFLQEITKDIYEHTEIWLYAMSITWDTRGHRKDRNGRISPTGQRWDNLRNFVETQ